MYLSIYLSIKPARATAKLKLNGMSQVSQTCQADVNMQPAGQKCQLKKGRATNGVSHVYQTCQADVKTCHLKAKNAHLKKHTRETSAIYHVCQTCQGDGKAETEWSEPSISNLPGRREHAACRPKMPAKKRQGDEWRKPCISNMPGRRQNMPPEGKKCTSKKTYQGDLRYLSCMSNMPGRRQSWNWMDWNKSV